MNFLMHDKETNLIITQINFAKHAEANFVQ